MQHSCCGGPAQRLEKIVSTLLFFSVFHYFSPKTVFISIRLNNFNAELVIVSSGEKLQTSCLMVAAAKESVGMLKHRKLLHVSGLLPAHFQFSALYILHSLLLLNNTHADFKILIAQFFLRMSHVNLSREIYKRNFTVCVLR